jgi:hypothetical protein
MTRAVHIVLNWRNWHCVLHTLVKKIKSTDNFGDISLDSIIIVKWILETYSVKLGTRFNCLGIEPNGDVS